MRTPWILAVLLLASCGAADAPSPDPAGADLSGFRTARVEIGGASFEVWLAETPAQRMQGLMGATAEQLAPLPDGTPRGMLFVFPSEQPVSFVMRATPVPLDLAHFRTHAATRSSRPVAVGMPVTSSSQRSCLFRCAAVVIARPTASPVLYEQMIGRGMRGPRFGGTDECLVVDVEDNIRFAGQMVHQRYANHWVSETPARHRIDHFPQTGSGEG